MKRLIGIILIILSTVLFIIGANILTEIFGGAGSAYDFQLFISLAIIFIATVFLLVPGTALLLRYRDKNINKFIYRYLIIIIIILIALFIFSVIWEKNKEKECYKKCYQQNYMSVEICLSYCDFPMPN